MIEFIADPGCNWESMKDLKYLMKECKWYGVSAFKPQLWECDKLYDSDNVFYDWQKSHELTFDQAKEIFEFGQEIELEVFFSVFDVERVKWCEEICVERYKIASSIPSDHDIVRAVCDTGKRIIT